MNRALVIYLRSHEAAARAGHDLFRRVASDHADRPYAHQLRRMESDVRQDLRSLQDIMRALGVGSDPVLTAVLRLGERLGRFKPNGHVVTRSPVSDLLEVEALGDIVQAKLSGWRALDAIGASAEPLLGPTALGRLVQRAESQALELQQIHHDLAAGILSG